VNLTGKRIVNTRAGHQAAEFNALLRKAGAIPLEYPCIDIQPPEDTTLLDTALREPFDLLVLTSANAVLVLMLRLRVLGLSFKGVKAAAVGEATAQTARRLLGVEITLIPDNFTADTLGAQLPRRTGMRILLPQSEIARPTLAESLKVQGIDVIAVAAYRTMCGSGGVELAPMLRDKQVDAVTFTSSSTAQYFVERLRKEGASEAELCGVRIASIGGQTSQTIREIGLSVTVEAKIHTLYGLIDGLNSTFEEHR
jgi:uroporphyrinogen-III synthase